MRALFKAATDVAIGIFLFFIALPTVFLLACAVAAYDTLLRREKKSDEKFEEYPEG